MTTRLRGLITDLVHDAGIDVIQVEGRAKTVDSFVEKIGRKGKKYDNPFTDMTDLIGLRVITYYHEDVARIGEILKGEFKELRRRLFRLSALFELADEQFSELRDARARIEAEHAADVREGHLDIPLDEASLAVYLDDSGKSDTVGKMITDTGGKLYGQDERALAKDRRDLLRLLNIIEITTISQLDDYLAENILAVPVTDTDLFRKVGPESAEDALTMLIMAQCHLDYFSH